jgi:hypothetical protein
MWNSIHAAPWSTHYDERDMVYGQTMEYEGKGPSGRMLFAQTVYYEGKMCTTLISQGNTTLLEKRVPKQLFSCPQIKSDCIGHIHMVSRCYCECSEMLVLLVPTVQ